MPLLDHPSMNVFLRCAVLASLFFVTAGSDEIVYNIRRTADTQKLLAAKDFVLTFSEEGTTKVLPTFLLYLFQTTGWLTIESIEAVGDAMNKFLLPEINRKLLENRIRNEVILIETAVLASQSLSPVNRGRKLFDRQGTEMVMELTVTFDHEPSPLTDKVNVYVKEQIMPDLTFFLTNLTEYKSRYPQLRQVDEAYRREHPTDPPTASPIDTTKGLISDPDDGNVNLPSFRDSPQRALRTVPTVLGGASVLALAAWLVFRRRRQSSVMSPKGDSLYVDVDGDLYSMDPSLESGPGHMQSPPSMSDSPSMQSSAQSSGQSSLMYNGSSVSSRGTSPMAGDSSVFSGLESPRHSSTIRASKSILSGFTQASTATDKASNVRDRSIRLLNTPTNMGRPGSLLSTFAEEGDDADDEYEEEDGRGPPRMTTTEDSEDSLQRDPVQSTTNQPPNREGEVADQPVSKNPLANCNPWYSEDQAVTPKDVLADLADFDSNRSQWPRDPTPRQQESKPQDSVPPVNPTGSGSFIPSPQPTMFSYANLMGCTPTISCTVPSPKAIQDSNEAEQAMETTHPKDPNLSSAKATLPRVSSPLARALIQPRPSFGSNASEMDPPSGAPTTLFRSMAAETPDEAASVDSRMETPMKRNTGEQEVPDSNAATTGSGASQKSMASGKRVQVEWDNNVAAPGTVGVMSATATKLIGGIFGASGGGLVIAGGSPSKSTISKGDGADNYASPRSAPEPTHDEGLTTLGTTKVNERSKQPEQKHKEDPPEYDEEYINAGCFPSSSHKRRHAGNAMGQDGSAMYQTNAMHPLDWSLKSVEASVGDSTISEAEGLGMPRHFAYDGKHIRKHLTARSPNSHSHASTLSEDKTKDTRGTNASSQVSSNRQLINDLVWLEKKIAKDRGRDDPYAMALTTTDAPPAIETADSLSYQSIDNDGFVSPSSNEDSGEEPSILTGKNDSVMSSIVCRDVYAPPGKLHIVIHSTKDGPAVHTVKEGSSLEGHIFSGDLIIGVDNVDTRGYTAEQVMKTMASRSSFDRKITVLHFEEEEE